MLRQRLTLLLLAFLALLQGLVPLLHGHAGGSPAGAPHFHVSVGTTGDFGLHLDGSELRAHGETVIDAADGLPRDESLGLVDELVVTASLGACCASPSVALVRGPAMVTPLRSAAFARPPSRAPPLNA